MATTNSNAASSIKDVPKIDYSKTTANDVKTLIIDLSTKFGGASSRVLSLMQNFPPDQQVALAVLRDSPIGLEALRLGLPVYVVGNKKTNPLILYKLISLIKSNGYQVLDTQNPQSKFWGSFAGLLTGASVVSTLNSWYVDEHGHGNLKGLFYALLELGTNLSLKRYIVVSQSIFDVLIRFRISPKKIHLIYNAVDTQTEDVFNIKSALVEKYNLPTNSLLIVTAGRFVWAKGYDDLIRAFQLVAETNPNVYCLIAGDGDLYLELKKNIGSAGINDRVFLLGRVSRTEVLSLIKACDVFVMSSRSEGTPMVILEAASLQKPIVATNVGGIPELLEDEKECVLVPPGNARALADGMEKILTNKHLSERLAQAAFLRVKQNFSVRNQAQKTLSVYGQAWLDKTLV